MDLNLGDGVLWYAVFLFSTVLHEAAHAWTALKLGDDTASRGGQVSINPLPHVRREPIGMVVVPILSWMLGGWLIGWASAPYDIAWARQYPRRAALMALAGPGANLALVAAAGLCIRLGLEWQLFEVPYSIGMSHVVSGNGEGAAVIAKILSVVFSLNLLLFIFNLLPIPPLDGSNLPLLVLPEAAARRYSDIVRSPILQLAGFVLLSRGLGSMFPPILTTVAALLYPGFNFG
jgi:Zn-dependent protease